MNALINETGAELLKALRAPEFILPTLLVPCAFYAIFGVMLDKTGNSAIYLLATYGVFAVMGPSIFGFGVGVANERDRGWLELKRAAPAPAYSYISAKLITTLLFTATALMPIYLIAGFVGGVELTRETWISLFLVHLSATIPFVLIGLCLGLRLSSGGAVAISNILFLGLAILGGLWFPVFLFPSIMQSIAAVTPSFHMAEMALAVVGKSNLQSSTNNLLWVSVMSLTFLSFALWSWSRQQRS